MLANTPMKMVRVSGSHREMGRQLVEACAPEIHRMLDVYRASLQTAYNELHLTWPEAMLQASKYYPFAREHTPQYVEELEGMAEAAGVAFDELMVVNCIEAITSDALHLGCTSLAVSGERCASSRGASARPGSMARTVRRSSIGAERTRSDIALSRSTVG